MKIMYELQDPFRYSWKLAIILIIVIIMLVISYILAIFIPRFYNKKYGEIVRKATLPSLKSKYIRKLENL